MVQQQFILRERPIFEISIMDDTLQIHDRYESEKPVSYSLKAIQEFQYIKSKTDMVGSIISFLGNLFGGFTFSKPTTDQNVLQFMYRGQKKCYYLHECNLEKISQIVNFIQKRTL